MGIFPLEILVPIVKSIFFSNSSHLSSGQGGESMELSIQERLKDLRVERGLTLEQLAEETKLSKSALGSYEADDLKDISHYALIKLAKFYEVTTDYILGRSKNRNHPNADLADLRLSNDMIELLKSGLIDNSLLCELVVHPNFPPTPAY